MIRILIADDHSVVRSGLKQFLADAPDCRVAGEAGSGQDALAMVRKSEWGLVMLDIGLPDMDGIELLRRIKSAKPELPVLVFSMYPEDDYAMRALGAGAAGYLVKDSAPDEILRAIRRAAAGGRYVGPDLAEKLLTASAPPPRTLPHEALSPRELQVMLLLSKGIPLKDIAAKIHLSPKTVTTYRTRVLAKLGMSSNTDLTRYAIEHKLG